MLRLLIEPIVRTALIEDLGRAGDITSEAIVPRDAVAEAEIVARQPGVLAGLDAALLAFELADPGLRIEPLRADGAGISRGDIVARIGGGAWGALAAERTALNFLCRMSGIATATRKLADAIAGSKAKIICTRKTTPGLRALEKEAVRLGGGEGRLRYLLHFEQRQKDRRGARRAARDHAARRVFGTQHRDANQGRDHRLERSLRGA